MPFEWKPIEGIVSALDVFVGYLLLDAWIGNTDRHHENWGFVLVGEANERGRLAPRMCSRADVRSRLKSWPRVAR